MPDYRLYYFSGRHIERAQAFVAPHDAAAIDEAGRRAGGSCAEIWRGAIRLKVFNAPDGWT